jgi:hypothetical protein
MSSRSCTRFIISWRRTQKLARAASLERLLLDGKPSAACPCFFLLHGFLRQFFGFGFFFRQQRQQHSSLFVILGIGKLLLEELDVFAIHEVFHRAGFANS